MRILAGSTGWFLLAIVGQFSARQESTALVGAGYLLLLTASFWAVLFAALIFLYPEWPHNLRLCRRLRSRVRKLGSVVVRPFDVTARVVELVPRDRWKQVCLDTATDLMLLKTDERGLWMQSDRFEYRLPRESIMGAQYDAITPPGWFCRSHMVIVYVRTKSGTVDLPLSFRDFDWGSLRSSRRLAETLDLVDRINGIACGSQYDPPEIPRVDAPHNVWSGNPYAAPSAIED